MTDVEKIVEEAKNKLCHLAAKQGGIYHGDYIMVLTELATKVNHTATAKLREDVFNAVFPRGTENGNESWEQILKTIRDTNEELMEAMKQLRESDVEIAKAREELEIKERDYLELKRAMWGKVNRLTEQLTHQPLDSAASTSSGQARDKQPSAITTNEQAYRDGTLSQPSEDFSKSGLSAGAIQTWREASETEQSSAPTAENESFAPFFEDVEKKTTQELAEIVGVQGSGSRAAESHTRGLRNKSNKQTLTPATMPTADVEKIAREYAERQTDHQFRQREIVADLLQLFAQARAPLVEAIDVAIALLDQCKDISARKVLNAVLTGTGEKHGNLIEHPTK